MTEAGRLALRDPRTGRTDGSLPMAGPADIASAAAALRAAQRDWAQAPVARRCQVLGRFAAALRGARHELLAALLADTGRWHESVLELDGSLAMLERWVAAAPAALADPPPAPASVPFVEARQRQWPYALAGVISPWNFPLLLTLIDAVPALAAGCAVLAKPSEVTPRFIAPLQQALARVPELAAVFRLLVGDRQVGAALVGAVDLVCFTGSVASGRRVAAACAERLIPASLELGGKDPALVLAGADLERAAQAICWAGFVNAGQSCMSIERVYVEAPVADQFIARLVAHARRLRLAWPDPRDGEIGPIISAAQVSIVREHLQEARARGARALTGGEVVERGGGSWCPPTVLVDVSPDLRVMTEETFAAILPVQVVTNVEAAIAAANASSYGLSAAVFAATPAIAVQVASRIEAGAVSINDASLTAVVHSAEKHSFKSSGLGGSRMGPASIRRFLRTQALLVNPGVVDPWWYPAPSPAGG